MLKSMTGYSKTELSEEGYSVSVEIKSLNGRYLEQNIRMPRNLLQFETEVRDIVKRAILRGTVQININVEHDDPSKVFVINEDAAEHTFKTLDALKKRLKLRETVKLEHVLHFSNNLLVKEENKEDEKVFGIVKKALRDGLRDLDNTKKREGKNIYKDIDGRLKKIGENTSKIENMGVERIPIEREKLRQRIARLFESDEFDEQRLQTEMVLMADKLDISEECVRLNSHLKYFSDLMGSNNSEGRKINFLLQEMHREINTIGSKINDANVSQLVVDVKEEIERIREQIQNIE